MIHDHSDFSMMVVILHDLMKQEDKMFAMLQLLQQIVIFTFRLASSIRMSGDKRMSPTAVQCPGILAASL